MRSNIYKYAATLVVCLAFGSCRFGESAEDVVNKHKQEERHLLFSMNIAGPDGSLSSRVTIKDDGLNGLLYNWEYNDAIAIFDNGDVLSNKDSISPLVPCLAYVSEEVSADGESGFLKGSLFQAIIRAKIGNNAVNAKEFYLLQPYDPVATYRSNASSVTLDFTGQDGSLSRLAKEYQYSWGKALGICLDEVVTLTDNQTSCNVEWHVHEDRGRVVLDSKVAIVRFAMLYQPTDLAGSYSGAAYALSDYLKKQGLIIHHIEIENLLENGTKLSKAKLDMRTGLVSELKDADASLVIQSPEGYIKTVEVREDDAIDGDGARSWGTSFYVSMPCPEGTMRMQPLVKVFTCDATTHKLSEHVFYGKLNANTVKEANFYLTAPIKMVSDKALLKEESKLYRYYNSSFVWEPVTIE
ncbi:MAG: hypothetical protein Q4B58_04220 [Bacteroidales bacterium]|nr:hypothetical protein [Bacteroidales bacterium]